MTREEIQRKIIEKNNQVNKLLEEIYWLAKKRDKLPKIYY
jgi:hypothetical protein